MMGASQSALSIQNPSQTGPRTQGDGDFEIRGAASAISTTAPVEGSAAIPQLGYARRVFRSARTLFVRRYRYLLSCMSTPAPVALTATPLWVERSTTVTPA